VHNEFNFVLLDAVNLQSDSEERSVFWEVIILVFVRKKSLYKYIYNSDNLPR
jgi:hypothetical protein